MDWWGFKGEAGDAIPYNVALMVRAGVLTSVNSDDAELARRLNLDAAKAMKYGGLTGEEKLKLYTLNPPKKLRLVHPLRALHPPNAAELAFLEGPHFSPLSRYE